MARYGQFLREYWQYRKTGGTATMAEWRKEYYELHPPRKREKTLNIVNAGDELIQRFNAICAERNATRAETLAYLIDLHKAATPQ